MKASTIIIILIIFGLAALGIISWRRREKEREEMDAEYRQKVLRKNKTQPLTDEEQDYLLKLQAGRKPDKKRPDDR